MSNRSIARDIARYNETHLAQQLVEVDGVTVDANKRTFLKLAGVAGLGLVASQVLPKNASAYVMGSSPTSAVVGIKDSSNTRIDPAKETGGNLATIATNTTKIGTLTFDGSNNLMVNAATGFSSQLENASSVIINPATEDTLALIKTQTNKLNFDVSGNLLTAGAGGGGGVSTLQDTAGVAVNPSSDDSLVYLRRMVKLMESQATVDIANRQRVAVETMPVTAVSYSSGTFTISGAVTVASTTLTTVNGWDQRMFADPARTAYTVGIRQNLTFS